jgi:hypothetical protein
VLGIGRLFPCSLATAAQSESHEHQSHSRVPASHVFHLVSSLIAPPWQHHEYSHVPGSTTSSNLRLQASIFMVFDGDSGFNATVRPSRSCDGIRRPVGTLTRAITHRAGSWMPPPGPERRWIRPSSCNAYEQATCTIRAICASMLSYARSSNRGNGLDSAFCPNPRGDGGLSPAPSIGDRHLEQPRENRLSAGRGATIVRKSFSEGVLRVAQVCGSGLRRPGVTAHRNPTGATRPGFGV